MKDLTKGKPSALILSFALPIFLGNLLQLTYSLVDTRIVGSFLGEDALAAVGATSTLSGLIIGFLLGLSNGFAIITAQKFGAKNIADMKKSFAMSLVIGTGISILFTIAGLLFLKPILHFLNVPKHLVPVAKGYIAIIIAGLLATFLYDACAATLRAIGDAVTPLIILAISVALNIVGDLFFVVVLKTGVKGAAIATVLAQIIAFVICWIYMIRKYEILRLQKEEFKDPSPIMVKEMISAGMSMGFMSSLVNIGTLTLQTAINKLGKDIIIANKAMYNIYGKALRLAPTSASVMLTGESGTGKDVLARFIHQSSLRKHENFIHVNMATIPKPLFESELFGYTPGSFPVRPRAVRSDFLNWLTKERFS